MKRALTVTLVLFSGAGLLGFSLDSKATEKTQISISRSTKVDPAYRTTLENLQKTVPLTYNESVQRMIDNYSGQKQRFSRILGLSKYYFPIYERVFKEKGLPEELKYLSVVESSLNPNAQSFAGATGLWQFLTPVGKLYGLTIDDTLDERKDPVLASAAAADYLLKSYAMYNDWLLAIASYNCGHNNIRWARENAGGGDLDYWAIRKYLPVETQNYVPSFIAMVYIMNNHKRHGIYPADAGFNIFTNTLTVNKKVSLWDIAKATDVNIDVLSMLNASYKNQIVSGSVSKPKKLVIPEIKPYIYTALKTELLNPEPIVGEFKLAYVIPQAEAPLKSVKVVIRNTSVNYKVQEGDTLSSIAEKFNGTEEEIKIINKLKHYAVKPGMILRIIQG
jgi:membrane-bound lytic murein transglycosylase D